MNATLAEIFGYESPDALIGANPLDLVARADRERVEANLRHRIGREIDSVSYEFTGLRKDGTSA